MTKNSARDFLCTMRSIMISTEGKALTHAPKPKNASKEPHVQRA